MVGARTSIKSGTVLANGRTPCEAPRGGARGRARGPRVRGGEGALGIHARMARGGCRDRRRLDRGRSARTRAARRSMRRPVGRPGLHRRPHAPGVVEAARRRVRATRAAVRDDRSRRGSARDRQRPRDRRRALAARRDRGAAAGRLLHGIVLRTRVTVRVAAPRADARRPRIAPAAPAGDRACRDDELPGRHLGCGVPSSRSSSSLEHVDGHAQASSAGSLQGVRCGRDPLRPRGLQRRRGTGAAARRHVAADSRRLGGAEPARAPATARGVRAVAHRVLHRRPRAGAHRRRRPHQLDGSRRGRVRHPRRGCTRLRRR